MTNPMKGEIQIELGGETHPCRLTVDALIKIETELDTGVLALTQKIADADIRLSQLSVVLYHALRGGGQDLTHNDIKKMIAASGIVACSAAVAQLLVATLSDPNSEDTEKK